MKHNQKVAEFLLKAFASGCIIIPARVYSRCAKNGSTREEHFVGILYAAMPYYPPDIVLSRPEPRFNADNVLVRHARWHDTPQGALEYWERECEAREQVRQPIGAQMPYKSKAQRGYFHANREELEKQGVDVKEWDRSSKGKKLPEHAPKPRKK